MRKNKVTIMVTTCGGEYFATRILENFPNYEPYGELVKVFSVTEEILPAELEMFQERVRQECRKRGIARVINLDE